MSMLEFVIPTMLASGIVGGLINSYLSDPAAEKPLKWWQHIVVGIGAAFMVPVFLNMISSRLISEIKGDAIDSEILSKLLVLAGFCLLASVSSRNFIRSMTDRLLQEVSAAKRVAKEAKQQAANAEAIASLTVEPELPSTGTTIASEKVSPDPAATGSADITDIEMKILQAMVNSRFSMRSITGISKDSGIPKEDVNAAISGLLAKELVVEGKNQEGQLRWHPSVVGRLGVRGL